MPQATWRGDGRARIQARQAGYGGCADPLALGLQWLTAVKADYTGMVPGKLDTRQYTV